LRVQDEPPTTKQGGNRAPSTPDTLDFVAVASCLRSPRKVKGSRFLTLYFYSLTQHECSQNDWNHHLCNPDHQRHRARPPGHPATSLPPAITQVTLKLCNVYLLFQHLAQQSNNQRRLQRRPPRLLAIIPCRQDLCGGDGWEVDVYEDRGVYIGMVTMIGSKSSKVMLGVLDHHDE
jgi:hypothetical protein